MKQISIFMFSKIVSVFIMLIALAVMGGWIYGGDLLLYVVDGGASMKFSTALCFFLSGFSLYTYSCNFLHRSAKKEYILVFCSIYIFAIMSILLAINIFLGSSANIFEDLMHVDSFYSERVWFGNPSIGTILCFIVIAIVGLLQVIDEKSEKKYMKISGKILIGFGFLAIVGYIANIPQLYTYSLNTNIISGIAIHTAILFILIGSIFHALPRTTIKFL